MNESQIESLKPNDLVELYNKINEFIIYLESSIIEDEEGEEKQDEWVFEWNGSFKKENWIIST